MKRGIVTEAVASLFAAASLFVVPIAIPQQLQVQNAFPNLTFTRPVDLQHAGDSSNRLFVVEQAGIIRVFDNSSAATTASTFLDIRLKVDDRENEEGLLGLAFHPDYENNGYFYVNYTAASPSRTVIARYQVRAANPDKADSTSEKVMLEFSQPFDNHNGGQVAFGPNDGYLYIASGDGGSGGDPQGNGQNLRTLLGKILRIDVDTTSSNRQYGIPPDNPFANNTAGNREEIFAYGLRNPWRMSFDLETGRLWSGDVGQGRREEVDIIVKGGNYGWNRMEGNLCYPSGNTSCDMTGLILPVLDYGRTLGASITGGYVYRGSTVPRLAGAYVFADFISGRIWSLHDKGGSWADTLRLDTALGISSFGVDQQRELYICAFDGRIYRFTPTPSDVDENPLPGTYTLAQNYPNPFNPGTTIEYVLENAAEVELSIFNLRGQRIQTLVNARQESGPHSVTWEGRDTAGVLQASGIYFYRLKLGDRFAQTRRMVFLR
jgi:glucose/arabinose dehydrogenase